LGFWGFFLGCCGGGGGGWGGGVPGWGGGGRSREVLADYEDRLNRNISEFPVFIIRLEIQYFAQ